MNKNWFRPYGSEKECWLAAMALLYESKQGIIEFWNGYEWSLIYRNDWIIRPSKDRMIRPQHKHRALIDLYWKYPGSFWWSKHPTEGKVLIASLYWGEDYSYEPSKDNSELYAEYLKLVESGVVVV